MNSRKNASDAGPALALLHKISKAAKKRGIWRLVDEMFAKKGSSEEYRWPDYVFLPYWGWNVIASAYFGAELKQFSPQFIEAFDLLAVAGTWRLTQDIIRFDPDLYRALAESSLEGGISLDFLRRLPTWCVYIETPGLILNYPKRPTSVDGFWAMIYYHVETRSEALSLIFLNDDGSRRPCIFPINENRGISDALRHMSQPLLSIGAITSNQLEKTIAWMREAITVALNLLLYVCAYWKPAGTGRDGRGVEWRRPEQKKVKKGMRFFPADGATVVELGARVGDAIRAARKREETAEEPAPDGGRKRRSPRPHIRRGHWHGYWTGPRNPGETQESREFALRWISPIPVALGEDGDAESYMRRDGTARRGEMRPDVAIPA